jgi:hypothetical protein
MMTGNKKNKFCFSSLSHFTFGKASLSSFSVIAYLKPLMALPKSLPISGNLFAPNIKKAMIKITISSGNPRPNILSPSLCY